ncbi:ZIP family metal transporter [Mycoplasmopsis caviae]|uniref:ZIP Zinc transporter n=1 Tax=Mycoplasmopsis caviae TaxID=55603 RepID=A0A3P8L730_9BACT|nr:ZIP family metal transporter [Mycoplasmopsis caviae]UUD35281.1 ZIP family metal transporter [Mycoplasmopsis caviae]VDR41935.1 ZIP Zinc transporter [Mycoplasmopsis caviae]
MKKFIKALENGAFSIGTREIAAKFYLILIAFAIIFLVPILVSLIVPLFKKKLSKNGSTLLYAFVTGFFLTMALFGFLKEALEISSTYAPSSLSANATLSQIRWATYGWNILLIVSGLIGGLIFAFSIKYLVKSVSKKHLAKSKASVFVHSHEHVQGDNEQHSHMDNLNTSTKADNRLKIVALLLLLTHRIPEGFLIGYSLNNLYVDKEIGTLGFAFFISFIMHLIPEEIVFYYRQREMGVSRWKAISTSIGCLFLFLPMMLLGIFLGKYIQNIWQLRAFLQATIAGIFFFTATMEFLPEFYSTHYDAKMFKKVMITFMAGLVVCALILAIHQHGKFN